MSLSHAATMSPIEELRHRGEDFGLVSRPSRHLHLFDHETGEALRAPAWPGAVVAD